MPKMKLRTAVLKAALIVSALSLAAQPALARPNQCLLLFAGVHGDRRAQAEDVFNSFAWIATGFDLESIRVDKLSPEKRDLAIDYIEKKMFDRNEEFVSSPKNMQRIADRLFKLRNQSLKSKFKTSVSEKFTAKRQTRRIDEELFIIGGLRSVSEKGYTDNPHLEKQWQSYKRKKQIVGIAKMALASGVSAYYTKIVPGTSSEQSTTLS